MQFFIPNFLSCLLTVSANGDEFSRGIFYDAGKYLAKHIVGLLPKVDQVRDKERREERERETKKKREARLNSFPERVLFRVLVLFSLLSFVTFIVNFSLLSNTILSSLTLSLFHFFIFSILSFSLSSFFSTFLNLLPKKQVHLPTFSSYILSYTLK